MQFQRNKSESFMKIKKLVEAETQQLGYKETVKKEEETNRIKKESNSNARPYNYNERRGSVKSEGMTQIKTEITSPARPSKFNDSRVLMLQEESNITIKKEVASKTRSNDLSESKASVREEEQNTIKIKREITTTARPINFDGPVTGAVAGFQSYVTYEKRKHKKMPRNKPKAAHSIGETMRQTISRPYREQHEEPYNTCTSNSLVESQRSLDTTWLDEPVVETRPDLHEIRSANHVTPNATILPQLSDANQDAEEFFDLFTPSTRPKLVLPVRNPGNQTKTAHEETENEYTEPVYNSPQEAIGHWGAESVAPQPVNSRWGAIDVVAAAEEEFPDIFEDLAFDSNYLRDTDDESSEEDEMSLKPKKKKSKSK